MTDKVYVGNRVGSLTAGDDTGRHLEYDMPWATQEIVDNVLKNLYGFVYKPFNATDAMIDPAAELGDGVTINGQYFMLAQMTTRFDAKGASDIGAPSTGEMDYEYPYKSPQDRELKRRVKLEQSYYGAKISRREGLVIEKVIGEAIAAKVVLNAEKLAFYDGDGKEQLYFDPAAGCYKFRGALNVNDNFIVDKLGNVVMKGDINLSDASVVRFGKNAPTKKQFSVSASGPWHEAMQDADKWRQDWDYATETWGAAYQFRGTDGKNGLNGSDATVPKYITDTVIAKGVIEAPRINANDFTIYPNSPEDYDGSFVVYGMHMGKEHPMFKIEYVGSHAVALPAVNIGSPTGAPIYLGGSCPIFIGSDFSGRTGMVDFSRASEINWGDNAPTAVFA